MAALCVATLSRFSAPALIFSSTSNCCVNSSNYGISLTLRKSRDTVAVRALLPGLELGRTTTALPVVPLLPKVTNVFPAESLSPRLRDRKLLLGVVACSENEACVRDSTGDAGSAIQGIQRDSDCAFQCGHSSKTQNDAS
jgi:hypothetical protein